MLTFSEFTTLNLERCKCFHPGGVGDWSPLQWAVCVGGEAGECLNEAKKIWRGDGDMARLRMELADVFIYANLLGVRLNVGGIVMGKEEIGDIDAIGERASVDTKDVARVDLLCELFVASGACVDHCRHGKYEAARGVVVGVMALSAALIYRHGGVPAVVIAQKFNEVSTRIKSQIRIEGIQ